MRVRIFHHRSLHDACLELGVDLAALKEDFSQYKKTGMPPGNFGRDAEYNHPNSLPIVRQARIAHIHIENPDQPWHMRTVQFGRTSDTHLVYCRGIGDPNCYLLMALLSPDAHDQARNNNIMFNLGKMAEKFRNKY